MADKDSGDNLIWFLAGVAVGVAAGMLFAPRAGREIRRMIGEKTVEGKDYLVDAGRDVYAKSREIYEKGKDLAEDAAELFERGRKAVRL
ncbi:MAG: YtxH domain-containing protein [Acidobacteria bacterium]|nr:YtxH domain-containing protein [Acidobacteriota bacterium]MBI3697550.1 YtxH domain-containing protein [Acidobacteriota bacterium]